MVDLAEISVSSVSPGLAGQHLTAESKSPAPAEPAAEPEPPRSCGDSSSPGHPPCNVKLQNTAPGTPQKRRILKQRGQGWTCLGTPLCHGREVPAPQAVTGKQSPGVQLPPTPQSSHRTAGAAERRLRAVPRGWPLSSTPARFVFPKPPDSASPPPVTPGGGRDQDRAAQVAQPRPPRRGKSSNRTAPATPPGWGVADGAHRGERKRGGTEFAGEVQAGALHHQLLSRPPSTPTPCSLPTPLPPHLPSPALPCAAGPRCIRPPPGRRRGPPWPGCMGRLRRGARGRPCSTGDSARAAVSTADSARPRPPRFGSARPR